MVYEMYDVRMIYHKMCLDSLVLLVLFYLLEADLPLQNTSRLIYSHPNLHASVVTPPLIRSLS